MPGRSRSTFAWQAGFLCATFAVVMAVSAGCTSASTDGPLDGSAPADARQDARKRDARTSDDAPYTAATDAADTGRSTSRCEPGTLECPYRGSKNLYRCNDSGLEVPEPCPDGAVCVGTPVCIVEVCQAGQYRCEGDARMQCARDGSGWMAAPCATDSVCVPDGRQTHCEPRLCAPGTSGCSPDGRGLGTCAADGMGFVITTWCASDEACGSNRCEKQVAPVRGSMRVIYPGHAPRRLALPRSHYALAVVSTVTSSDAMMPLPLAVSSSQSVALSSPALRPRQETTTDSLRLRTAQTRVPCATLGLLQDDTGAPPPPPAARPFRYVLGDTRSLSIGATGTPTRRTVALRHIGNGVQIWDDITDSADGTVTDADARDLAALIADVVLARLTPLFGALTDVDQNGALDVVLSPYVGVGGVGGYVSPWNDLYASPSRRGEYLYLDPTIPVQGLASVAAHELEHLIYYGQRLGAPLPAPEWARYDVYAAEGVAELAAMWSGLGNTYVSAGLAGTDEWSLARLLGSTYTQQRSLTVQGPLYGMGAIWLSYLFEQHGGAAVASAGALTDLGGGAFLRTFTGDPSGFYRFRTAGGRRAPEVYADLAAALLLGTIDTPDLPAEASRAEYTFFPFQTDPFHGGRIGVPVRGEDRGIRVTRKPLAMAATMRSGGIEFLDLPEAAGDSVVEMLDDSVGLVVVPIP